ncbi:MAG: hypothetical protein ACKVQT_34190 [Burkholderiales bacterium]
MDIIPKWPTLRRLEANKVIRAAHFWTLAVPITAKLLEHVEDVVTVRFFDASLNLHLTLPFSWKVLFFAAISFLIANVIFGLLCPQLIKETSSYRDFAAQRRSAIELQAAIRKLLDVNLLKEEEEAMIWFNWLGARWRNVVSAGAPTTVFTKEGDDQTFPEAYTIVIHGLAQTKESARLAASIFYGCGLILLGIIVVENVIFVARHL